VSKASIAYEKKRYAANKKKRIAAETAYKAKMKGNPKFDQKVKARSAVRTAVRNGSKKPPATCPICGRRVKLEWHHSSYATGAGGWRCARCNARGGAAKGAKKK
jgi:hypothetical protein